MSIKRNICAVFAISITACGGGASSDKDTEVVGLTAVEKLPNFTSMEVPLDALSNQGATSFEQHLKNGIFLRNRFNDMVTFDGALESSSSSSTQSNFSKTITQEQGVDEGDRIKYDGEYMFIANQHHTMGILEGSNEGADEEAQTSIRVIQRESDGGLNQITEFDVSKKATSINSLYLTGSNLAVLSDIAEYNLAASTFLPFFPIDQKFNLALVSIENPSLPEVTTSLTIDGSVIDSRRIDNNLYIVSTFSASLNNITSPTSADEELAFYNDILTTNVEDFLPKYTDATGQEHQLVSPENCLLPENATELDGFDGIVTLTTINVENPSEIESVCINAQVQGVYASAQSIYLYGTEYVLEEETYQETSVIHKFAIEETTVNYTASGTLAGRFNWNLSNLRFSEQGDYLRVVTTEGDRQNGYTHTLNVLMDDFGTLTTVSQLPNNTHSKVIGKQSEDGNVYEDIQSVRFYENQAYIVTFLNTDPLYVIDLEDNLNPMIRGELEIPGYSAYLHPISDHLLLGVGQNVDPNRGFMGVAEDSDENPTMTSDEEQPVIEGAKVSLFNIQDMNNPKEIHSIVYEQAYTPVEFDYHALTTLQRDDNTVRFGMPIERWKIETRIYENEQKYDVWQAENQLALFEVTSLMSEANLVEVGQVNAEKPAEDQNIYYSSWDDRAIFHNDDIYYIHGSKVWQSTWSTPELVSEPF